LTSSRKRRKTHAEEGRGLILSLSLWEMQREDEDGEMMMG